MLGISTAWISAEIRSGRELLEHLKAIGLSALELEYRITEEIFKEIKPRLRKEGWQVLDLHNFCPLPGIVPPEKASADAFHFSSLDREERELAIKYGIRTIQQACDLEAKAVVFHLGDIDMEPETGTFYRFQEEGKLHSEEYEKFKEAKLKERRQKRQPHLDAVLMSLDRLNREAEKRGVWIGVENRCHYHEIPNIEDIEIILREFRGGAIRYWHDVGHAYRLESLGILQPEELLKRFQDELIGLHLHDARGQDDHWAPGEGEVDFASVAKYIRESTLCILEVHPKVSRESLQRGIEHLMKLGIQ